MRSLVVLTGSPYPGYVPAMPDADVELTIVTMTFDASDPATLVGILSKYVVVSRGHPGCRNIDLCGSVTTPNRFLIVQKWDSPDAQQAHFDSSEMVEMARACKGLLSRPPTIDLYEGLSAHDLA
jgi:quinol monooxygenase YgiN